MRLHDPADRIYPDHIRRVARQLWLVFPVCLLAVACVAFGQDEGQDLPPAGALSRPTVPDSLLPQIAAAIQGITSPDVRALSKALRVGDKPPGGQAAATANALEPLGDLDGDGVPEMLLKWAIPEVSVGAATPPEPDSVPLWSLYLVSWDGARWKVSLLLSGVEDFKPILIHLGPAVGRGIAIVTVEGEAKVAYPAVFQVKDHAATLLWDSHADDSRYQPLLQGQVSFQDYPNAPAEMILTGRADPGLLQVDASGRRGFQARIVYHWEGKTFIPGKPQYTADQDYTIYRFISALHLHDFASAYAVVDAGKLMQSNAPSLAAFRSFIQSQWAEFLEDQVFVAPEAPAGSVTDYQFVLTKADRGYVYHPSFSKDGRFLLTGLTRTQEALPEEP